MNWTIISCLAVNCWPLDTIPLVSQSTWQRETVESFYSHGRMHTSPATRNFSKLILKGKRGPVMLCLGLDPIFWPLVLPLCIIFLIKHKLLLTIKCGTPSSNHIPRDPCLMLPASPASSCVLLNLKFFYPIKRSAVPPTIEEFGSLLVKSFEQPIWT